MTLSEGDIRDAVSGVYEAVGRGGSRAPGGLGVHTGGELARMLGYHSEELATQPSQVLDAFVGAAALANEVTGPPGPWVLDLGCGAGVDGLVLAARGHRVAALDASGTMLRLASRQWTDRRLSVRALLPTLPFRSGFAGWALLNGVANLIPDRAGLLREVARSLAPGGTLLVADLIEIGPIPPELRSLPEAWAWCVGGATTVETWTDDLAGAGFPAPQVVVAEEFPPLARALLRVRKRGP
ncbi:MAG: methyltransferase domain-containing protein [Deltaproteobacteria bacterium]|nr:methyltransferase domain-containing protein [Deltaproteobacteria bacterium]